MWSCFRRAVVVPSLVRTSVQVSVPLAFAHANSLSMWASLCSAVSERTKVRPLGSVTVTTTVPSESLLPERRTASGITPSRPWPMRITGAFLLSGSVRSLPTGFVTQIAAVGPVDVDGGVDVVGPSFAGAVAAARLEAAPPPMTASAAITAVRTARPAMVRLMRTRFIDGRPRSLLPGLTPAFSQARMVSAPATIATERISSEHGRGRPPVRRDRKSTRLNSSHVSESRMPSSA